MIRRLLIHALIAAAAVITVARVPVRDLASRFGGEATSIDFGRAHSGDDPRWASPKFDDSSWRAALLWNLDSDPDQAVWLRTQVSIGPADEGRALAVYASILGNATLYWDGLLLGRTGPLDTFLFLDASMRRQGKHVLALRVAPGHSQQAFFRGLAVGEGGAMIRRRTIQQLVPVAGLGVFLVISAYYAATWLAARRRSDAVFALLCFAGALLVAAETWRWLLAISWQLQPLRLHVIDSVTFLISLLLPAFLTLEFDRPHKLRWVAGFAIVIAAAALSTHYSDFRCLRMSAASVALSISVLVEAWPARTAEWIACAAGVTGMAAALATGGFAFSDSTFFVAFTGLIAGLLVAKAVRARRERSERDSALLRAARLEIELLQKSIQPHFLMNTLTAVMEWIEDDPKEAARFIEAVADELRIFYDVSRKTLIPIEQELQLCRSHLEIMSRRMGRRFALETDGIEPSSLVPPAMFHTLIENAITHNRYRDDEIAFSIRAERGSGLARYTVDVPIVAPSRPRREEGLGLRYVRARLQESFPGQWRMDAGPVGDSWRTVIEVAS